MRDRPTGEDLLEIIARIKDGDPSIRLPEDGRYKALMIANAENIAARQAEAGDGPERQEREELSRLVGRAGGPQPGPGPGRPRRAFRSQPARRRRRFPASLANGAGQDPGQQPEGAAGRGLRTPPLAAARGIEYNRGRRMNR